ncbi:hypothetical protein JXA32_06055 [Candidatus Sumerlaeota bacterium]|nr:hypothetical protein [Candidatus Sumerlaeota bacterium]
MPNRNNKNQMQSPEQPDTDFLRDFIDDLRSVGPDASDYNQARRNLLQTLSEIPKESFIMSKIVKPIQSSPIKLTATGVSLLLVAMLISINLFGGNSGQDGYAQFAKSMSDAKIVTCNVDLQLDEKSGHELMKLAFNQDGVQRIETGPDGHKLVQITNTQEGKNILIIPEKNAYILRDVSGVEWQDKFRMKAIYLVQNDLKKMPEQADEILPGKSVNGKKALGYRVEDRSYWVDSKTNQLVLVDLKWNKSRMIMSNFSINPSGYDESMFKLVAPKGYIDASDKVKPEAKMKVPEGNMEVKPQPKEGPGGTGEKKVWKK